MTHYTKNTKKSFIFNSDTSFNVLLRTYSNSLTLVNSLKL